MGHDISRRSVLGGMAGVGLASSVQLNAVAAPRRDPVQALVQEVLSRPRAVRDGDEPPANADLAPSLPDNSPDFTQENFAVGWYSSAGSEQGDQATFHSLAETLSSQYAHNPDFLNYRKASEGATTVGSYNGYEFRFETASRVRKDIKIWGRVIFLPPVDGGRNGVTLLMFATSLAREVRSVDDVGVKGELPMMLESFRFGK